MARITVSAYTRRGKRGKIVRVRRFHRRVGRKGVHSPKETASVQPGKELEQKITARVETPKLTPEEIAQRKEFMEGFRRVEADRKALGLSKEQYSRLILKREKEGKPMPTPTRQVRTTSQPKKKMGVLEKAEDSVAKFVEKYSGKKYKRQL